MRPTHSVSTSTPMRPAQIALLAAIIPFLAVHLSYANSIFNDAVPSCIPYLEGCTSISRAARQGDSLHLFRALMLPTTTLLAIYWLVVTHRLQAIAPLRTRGMTAMVTLGVTGALLLILYATFLGTEGELYRWLRRYGVIFYFAFTALAQILLTQRLYQLAALPTIAPMKTLLRCKLLLCAMQWGIGLVSLPLGIVITNKASRDAMQNIVEWNFALAMSGFFLISFLMMRRTDTTLAVNVAGSKNSEKHPPKIRESKRPLS